jgi:hypothetical protein
VKKSVFYAIAFTLQFLYNVSMEVALPGGTPAELFILRVPDRPRMVFLCFDLPAVISQRTAYTTRSVQPFALMDLKWDCPVFLLSFPTNRCKIWAGIVDAKSLFGSYHHECF